MIVNADCMEYMRSMPESSVDAIVTDPPYGLGFMGKKWDALPPGREWAEECLRVLKPGGHLLAFGGTRTYHRLACAVEDAGFEIRDTIAWMYGSGFPKSHNLKDEWEGWGTALKPAHEPVVVARKPLVGTVAQNVLEFGTGAVNVDGCRVGYGPDDLDDRVARTGTQAGRSYGARNSVQISGGELAPVNPAGRWPANVVLDEQAAALLDEQTGELHSQDPVTRRGSRSAVRVAGSGETSWSVGDLTAYGDKGGASRFYYVAKASSRERNAGLEGFEERESGKVEDDSYAWKTDGRGIPRRGKTTARNVHPTVKPIALMRWLVRLVTPPGGTVLDPFAGSGTTGCACALEGFDFIGIEREEEYVRIAEARIAHWTPTQMEMAA